MVKSESMEEANSFEKHSSSFAFRPFGILEPFCIKTARKYIDSSIQLICEIATIRGDILKITQEYFRLKNEL